MNRIDSVHNIRSSALRFFSGTLISRATGFIRDVLMAYYFGVSGLIASFMVAYRFSLILRRFFGESTLQTAFTPQFEELKINRTEDAYLFFRNLKVLWVVLLVFIVLTSFFFVSQFCDISLFSIFTAQSHNETEEIVRLSLLMSPSLVFICLYGLNSAFLQAEQYYFITSLAPVGFNIVWIAMILLVGPMSNQMDVVPYLSFGIVFASFAQWLITWVPTRVILKKYISKPLWKGVHIFSKELFTFFYPLLLGMFGVGAVQINSMIDSLFAKVASSQGPAILWYAIRIEQLPLALWGIALSGALLPPMTRAFKSSDEEKFHLFLHQAIIQTLIFIVPISAFLFISSTEIVEAIYGYGQFDEQAIQATSGALQAYNLGLVPSILILILGPAFYSQDKYSSPVISSCFTVLINIALNALFTFHLSYGVEGIALATSISACCNCFVLCYLLRAHLKGLMSFNGVLQIIAITIALIAAFWGYFKFESFIAFFEKIITIPFILRGVKLIIHFIAFYFLYFTLFRLLSNMMSFGNSMNQIRRDLN